jgi:hypothetical protein
MSQNKSKQRSTSHQIAKSIREKPGQFKANVELNHAFRFYSTNGGLIAVTPTSILGAAGTMCTVGNTTVVTYANSFRINRIRIWGGAQVPATTVPTTVAVDWTGLGNSPSREVSDTTVSNAFPAFIDTSPPPNSLAAFWQTASSTTIFTLKCPVQSVVEVHLTLILADGNPDSEGTAITVATGTQGSTYWLALDSTHIYPPISLVTTF